MQKFPPPRPPAHRPVVACFCATFLKPEMLHIYRQLIALDRFEPFVIAQKREHADQFPFAQVRLVKKPFTHFLRRFWVRQIRHAPPQFYQSEVRRITAILKTERADLLHIYFGHAGVHLLPLIRETPLPAIVSFHGADAKVDMEMPKFRRAMASMLTAANLILARSESLARELVALGCAPEKIRLHRTGIPLDALPFIQRTAPTDDHWQLFQACRLIEKKGLPTSLRAFAKFARQFPGAIFTIAGEGPMLQELHELARDLQIADQVRFIGFLSQEKMRERFYTSHLFLHPSEMGTDGNQEGVPNAMLEAMATGLPAFATTHGGIPEAVEYGVSGILVPERDHEALGAAMLELAANPAQYAAMSAAASRAVAAKFEIKSQVKALESFYDEVLHRST